MNYGIRDVVVAGGLLAALVSLQLVLTLAQLIFATLKFGLLHRNGFVAKRSILLLELLQVLAELHGLQLGVLLRIDPLVPIRLEVLEVFLELDGFLLLRQEARLRLQNLHRLTRRALLHVLQLLLSFRILLLHRSKLKLEAFRFLQ